MSILITHSQAVILRSLLVSKGVGTNPSINTEWPIFATNEPSTPDNCITIYNTQGIINGCSQVDGEWYEQQGFQVRVRAALDEVARSKMNEITLVLDQQILRESVTLGSNSYCVHSTNRTSGVLSLGDVPNSSRRIYTVNGTAYIIEV